jgi:hypothetical protein
MRSLQAGLICILAAQAVGAENSTTTSLTNTTTIISTTLQQLPNACSELSCEEQQDPWGEAVYNSPKHGPQ